MIVHCVWIYNGSFESHRYSTTLFNLSIKVHHIRFQIMLTWIFHFPWNWYFFYFFHFIISVQDIFQFHQFMCHWRIGYTSILSKSHKCVVKLLFIKKNSPENVQSVLKKSLKWLVWKIIVHYFFFSRNSPKHTLSEI